jgi:hypothetical protein
VEVDAVFQQQPFKTADGRDPFELWHILDHERQGLPPLAPMTVEGIPDLLQPLAAEIAGRHNFKKHYQAVADFSFAQVPIESLITPQWWADLDYIEELSDKLGPDPSSEAQMRFAFAEGRINTPIVVGNQVQFTSSRRDLYADQVPTIKKTSEGSFEIVVRATSRPNYVQVAVIDGRLVLTNGVHKVCALYSKGLKTCYCVIRVASNLQEGGLNLQATSLYRDAVFRSARPAAVVDFLNPKLAGSLHLRSMYQIMQVGLSVGIFQVPALPASITIRGAPLDSRAMNRVASGEAESSASDVSVVEPHH